MKVIKGGKDKGKSKTPQYDHDWEAIENDLLTTTMSVRAIGRKNGVAEGAIRKYIKKEGIERDLSLKVKAAVRNKLVRNPVRKKTQVRTKTKSKVRTKKPSEKEMIEAAAEENISFIQTWDEIFLKTVIVATALKKDILKKVKIKLEKENKTITVDKYTPKEKAAVFNSVVNAETKVFEAMRKNLGIEDSGGQEAPALLMDYGTGDYEKELERRKNRADKV